MTNAPRDDAVRAQMTEATRRLAGGLTAEHDPRAPDAGTFRRAGAAYVAAFRAGMPAGVVAAMVAARVRSALEADDGIGHPAAAVARVVDLARRVVEEL